MTQKLAALVTGLCIAWLVLLPIGAIYLLIDIEQLGLLARENLRMPVQWFTVNTGQWYGLWLITALYLAVGYVGTWYLYRAFRSFAQGAWFDEANSRHLRRYAALLMLQAILGPLHFALASVILSLNHPDGQKLLSVFAGSKELTMIAAGLILWVLADLLVKGIRADAENRQFV